MSASFYKQGNWRFHKATQSSEWKAKICRTMVSWLPTQSHQSIYSASKLQSSAIKCKQNQIYDFQMHIHSVYPNPTFQALTMELPFSTPVRTDFLFPKALQNLDWDTHLTFNHTMSYAHCFDFYPFPLCKFGLQLNEINTMYTLYSLTYLTRGKHLKLTCYVHSMHSSKKPIFLQQIISAADSLKQAFSAR